MKILLLFLLFAALVPAGLPAAAPAPPETGVPFRAGAIEIDGRPDDPGWKAAAVLKLDRSPLGEPAAAPVPFTEIRLAYDETTLYVAFVCRDDDIRPAAGPDGLLHTGDVAELFIDGTGDRRRFFELQFNPAGLLRGTEHFFTGTELRLDADGLWTEWDKVGERQDCILSELRHAAGMLRDGEGRICGWFVEAALPAEELLRRTGRGSFEAGKRLLANFVRYDYAAGKAEPDMVFWSATVSGRPHRSPGRFGTLLLLPR